jgi:hypothetical protein
MEWIIAHASELTALLFALLGVFSVIAKLTPTEADNKILDKILSVVHMLGLTKK